MIRGMATRKTQPYRKGARVPGAALSAMLKGRTAGGYNPQDSQRQAVKLLTRSRKKKTVDRPDRPPRPDRPAR